MLSTARRKQLAVGLVFLAVLLGLFLWFNRIPKLDIVEADLAGATAPAVECFQGFCLESEPDSTLFSRWWDFSLAYLKLISLGMVFAFLIAGLTETFLLPQGSIYGTWSRPGVRGSLGGLLVGPAMNLCSACIVPIANAFRQRGAGMEAALAIVHGSSTLNVPALLMAALVFTPMLAGSRVGISLIAALFLGPLVAWLAGRSRDSLPLPLGEGRGEGVPSVLPPDLAEGGDEASWRAVLATGLKAWARASLRYFIRLAPVMVLAGFASALVIQWVSPDTVGSYLGNNPQGVAIAATLGLLINVPLMFEIPLVAALLLVGMGEAPAATLLFAAAAGGPVTFWGLARAMPRRAVATLAAATWGLAAVAGLGILVIAPLVGGQGVGIRASVTGVSGSDAGQSFAIANGGGELRVDRMEPSVVGAGGDVLVTVHGNGFVDGAGVAIDGVEAAWAFLGPDRLVALAPAHAEGTVDAVVTNPDGSSVSLANALTYQPPVFEEVSEQAGVAFTHYRDLLDIIPLSAGVIVFDYNGDGWQDVYVTATPDIASLAPEGDDENALFRNNGDGTFTDVAAEARVTDAETKGNGGCAADYDNDGDQDLFVANWGASRLFRNDGSGNFTDVAEPAGLADPDGTYRSMGCAWGDYDRDGWLDFIVVRHIDESNPDAFTKRIYHFDVRPLALFHNDGNGTFTEVTHLLGATPNPSRDAGEYGRVWGAGFQPAWVDFDNDGDPDLYVINDFGEYVNPNVLWRNDGPAPDGDGPPSNSLSPRGRVGVGASSAEWLFTDISQESGAGTAMFGMGLAVADYNSDGYLDMFVTNIGDNVLLSTADGETFRDTAANVGVAYGEFRRQQRVSWGTVFFDYDNDGYEDLYVASGYLDTDDINRREQPNLLFRNNGAGVFEDVSAVSGAADWGTGRGVAYADFDGDGCLDLFLVNLGRSAATGEPARLYHNRCGWGNNWLIVSAVGTTSNRDGIGARISLTAGGRTQIREVTAGASNSSQNMLPVHFGLGSAAVVDEITVQWPSGIVQTVRDVTPNQELTVTEP